MSQGHPPFRMPLECATSSPILYSYMRRLVGTTGHERATRVWMSPSASGGCRNVCKFDGLSRAALHTLNYDCPRNDLHKLQICQMLLQGSALNNPPHQNTTFQAPCIRSPFDPARTWVSPTWLISGQNQEVLAVFIADCPTIRILSIMVFSVIALFAILGASTPVANALPGAIGTTSSSEPNGALAISAILNGVTYVNKVRNNSHLTFCKD